jgi:hypothetical protein
MLPANLGQPGSKAIMATTVFVHPYGDHGQIWPGCVVDAVLDSAQQRALRPTLCLPTVLLTTGDLDP